MFFSKINSISTTDLEQQLKEKKDIAILDVREKDEFKTGHIKGAINMPLSAFDVSKLKKQEYYVICASGMRSKQACNFLTKQGYDVTNVSGGMSRWHGKIV